MKDTSTIAVLGGGGRTGKFLIAELLKRGYSLKLLLRKPEEFTIRHSFIEIVQGDAVDPKAIGNLLKDCRAVISTIGQRPAEPLVACQATMNILSEMIENDIRRYIVMSGINVDTPFDKKGPQTLAATAYMKSNFPVIQEDRQKAYTLLASSTLDWTLVRVPMIEFTNSTGPLAVGVDDCPGRSISAGSIADFLANQLSDRRYLRQAPFIATEGS